MADDGRNAQWDEVGRRFADLGTRLQAAWNESRTERPAGETAEGQGRGVTGAFEDLKTSISHTTADPGVREAATGATGRLTDALATNLRQLADWLEQHPPTGSTPEAGGPTVSTDKPGDPL
jgi:hypothetical protein